MIDLRAFTVLRCDHTSCKSTYVAPDDTVSRRALVLSAMQQGWTVSDFDHSDGDRHFCPHHPADAT